MKIQANDLKTKIEKRGIKISELLRDMNKLHEFFYPSKRKITRMSIYQYFNGHTPEEIRMYYIGAILNIPPYKLFKLNYDEKKFKEVKKILKEIS